MSLLDIGKRKNLTQMALNLAKTAEEKGQLPLVITNKELPIITESAYIIEALENGGYKVEAFTTKDGYGIKVSK